MKKLFLLFFTFISLVHSSSDNDIMQSVKASLNPPTSFNWTGDCCTWTGITCSKDKRVTSIQLGNQKLTGTFPPSLKNLTKLEFLDLQNNQLTGSVPTDLFDELYYLHSVFLDYNPFSAWSIPKNVYKSAATLRIFSAISANITGNIPEIFGVNDFQNLSLRLSFNQLSGGIPASFGGCGIKVLWLNNQYGSKLSGTVDVLQNMTELTQVLLHGNSFTGPLPDFSWLTQLVDLSLRDNQFTGPIPSSLIGLSSLKTVNISNNFFQGPMPKFGSSVAVDDNGINRFCLNVPGNACDAQVNVLLSVARGFGYPQVIASSWKGNDPCSNWHWIICSNDGNVTLINLKGVGLNGTISPTFGSFPSLIVLILANNNLTGTIPVELTSLNNLVVLDVSNNDLYGKIPRFRKNVALNTRGNVKISGTSGKKFSMGVIVGLVVCGVFIKFLILIVLCNFKSFSKLLGG